MSGAWVVIGMSGEWAVGDEWALGGERYEWAVCQEE